ncbi:MAG: phage tail sheath C-terminal domain-containing protein [Pseudomonadota bacterium]
MAQTFKTPGVYINEINAFPNSVVEVATAVPAFIGYTAKAKRGDTDLTNVPTRITSMAEFELYFGGPPKVEYDLAVATSGAVELTPAAESRFLLNCGMRFFFFNGGGPCWIVSIGGYVQDDGKPTKKQAAHFKAGLETLVKEPEPTMLVTPDAVLLPIGDWADVGNRCLQQCIEMQSRVAILDVYDGHKPRDFTDDDVISGANKGLRALINAEKPSYGMAYYPWLNTSLVDASEVNYRNLTAKSREALGRHVAAQWQALPGPAQPSAAQQAELLAPLTAEPADNDAPAVRRAHEALLAFSQAYKTVMSELLEAINVMPPAAAMAGVYVRTDNEIGVFKAPANTGIVSVVSPTVTISHDEQEDLNVPLDGKAINAIRTFAGRGVLIWGARTLDGNSQDWRYVNVRRTMIMLEQSIKAAAEAYVFAPNDSGTWLMVRNMIENFLNNQWKAGALVGARPEDAYDVAVGLGSTMTAVDILDGYMRVTVRVAVVRPAEFIVITFQQKMQTS